MYYICQIGLDTVKVEEGADHWWHDSFSGALSKMAKKKKSKKTKDESAPPTFDELYAATGGARLGMRARMSQKGKLTRAEKVFTASEKSVCPTNVQAEPAVATDTSQPEDEEQYTTEKESKKTKKDKKKSKKRKRESDSD